MLEARRSLTLLVALLVLTYGGASAALAEDAPSLKDAGVKGPATAGIQPFVGKLNGFEFYDVSKAPLEDPNACAADDRRELRAEELRRTGLDFVPTYLPRGARLDFAGGQACPDAVLIIQKDYLLEYGDLLTIAYVQAPRRIPGTQPRSQLRAVHLRSRQAVLTRSLSEFNSGELHMSDGTGSTGYYYISGIELPERELLKIGRGIVKR